MPKYYVPLVMVIEAESKEEAKCFCADIIDGLCSLRPLTYDGVVDIDNLEPMEAPDNWFDLGDLQVTFDGETFSLSIEDN